MIGQLICPQIDVTVEGAGDDFPSCDAHNWSGGWYITQTLASVTHFWTGGNAVFLSPLGGMLANDALHPGLEASRVLPLHSPPPARPLVAGLSHWRIR